MAVAVANNDDHGDKTTRRRLGGAFSGLQECGAGWA